MFDSPWPSKLLYASVAGAVAGYLGALIAGRIRGYRNHVLERELGLDTLRDGQTPPGCVVLPLAMVFAFVAIGILDSLPMAWAAAAGGGAFAAIVLVAEALSGVSIVRRERSRIEP